MSPACSIAATSSFDAACAGSTTIQADVDGTANGVAFVDAVVLEGVSTDLAGLLTNGNLVV